MRLLTGSFVAIQTSAHEVTSLLHVTKTVLAVGNITNPCDYPVWTQAGVEELATDGTLHDFGDPQAGDCLTDPRTGVNNRDKIVNMESAIQSGFIHCLWNRKYSGQKC